MKSRSGFTLMELMITMAVITILSSISVPIASQWMARHRFSGAVIDVLQTLRLARMTAVQQNQVVMFSTNKAAGTYEAWVDTSQDGVKDPGEQVIASNILPTGMTMTAAQFRTSPSAPANAYVRFDNMGFPTDMTKVLVAGTITIAGSMGESKDIDLLASGQSVIQ